MTKLNTQEGIGFAMVADAERLERQAKAHGLLQPGASFDWKRPMT